MEGIYVCRMKYPIFLLILKLSESLGYEPVRKKDGQEWKSKTGEKTSVTKGERGEMLAQFKSSKVCTLTTRRVVISLFVQMEHLISPKRWIPFQGQVRFQLNMAESRKHGTFFCNPYLSRQLQQPSENCHRGLLCFSFALSLSSEHYQKGILDNCKVCHYTKRGRKTHSIWLEGSKAFHWAFTGHYQLTVPRY